MFDLMSNKEVGFMKRILVLALSILLIVSLSACGASEKGAENDGASETSGKESTEKATKRGEPDKEEKGRIVRNIHVRRAIAMAIDKEALAKSMSNTAIPVNYLVPKNFAFTPEGTDFRERYPNGFLSYDPEEAKKEWKLAKEELGFDKLELEVLTFNGEDAGRMIDKLNEDLSKTLDGLSLKANQQTMEQKNEFSNAGKFYLSVEGWLPDYIDPLAFLELFSKESQHNAGSYLNEEYEVLLNHAKQSLEHRERFEKLQTAEKILLEDLALIPLYTDGEAYLIRPYLKNVTRDPHNTGFQYRYVSNDKLTDGKNIITVLGGADGMVLDVNKVMDQASINLINNLNEGLIRFDADGKIEPGIAESWRVSEDGMTYTFKLRRSRWSNGEELTAKDFVDSWQRLASPDTKSEYTTMLETAGIRNAIKVINGELQAQELGIKAIDKYTLEVALDRPVPYFLNLMGFTCFYPINRSFIEKQGDDYATSMDSILYNGPYKIISWDQGFGLDLARNESYWDFDKVANDGVQYRMAKDLDTALVMYDNHDIDICPLDGENAEQRKHSPDYETYDNFSVLYMIINSNFRK